MVKYQDIFGDAINVAARLKSLSPRGGVCVSRGVRDYVDKQSAYIFDDMGEQHVKNITEAIRAYSIRFSDGKAVLDNSAIDPLDNAPIAVSISLTKSPWKSHYAKQSGTASQIASSKHTSSSFPMAHFLYWRAYESTRSKVRIRAELLETRRARSK